MSELETAILYLGVVVALLSAVIAYIQKSIAADARDQAKRSADAAEKQSAIAEKAMTAAFDSAESARQSADAAVRGVELQELRRREEQRADLRMIQWSGTQGLVVKNYGQGVASAVKAFRFDNGELNSSVSSIGPGEEVGIKKGWRTALGSESPDPPDGASPAGHYTMRLQWFDASGENRDTGWVHVAKPP